MHIENAGSPSPSKGVFADIRRFLLRRPPIPTQVEIDSAESRERYSRRIGQHLGVPVGEYSVLNVHRIGIEAPAPHVFFRLMQRDATEVCWPNHLARFKRDDPTRIRLLGLRRWRLFNLTQVAGGPSTVGDDCQVIFRCSGGYPIGIFAIYARPSIPESGESGDAQLVFVVSFDFYGKKQWFGSGLVRRIWAAIHNRATGNILNRFKRLCEAERPV